MHARTTFESTHRIDAGLPAFDGHFPGAPVLPGAVLLAIVLRHIERQPALQAMLALPLQVQQVKFLAPVGPGHTLRIRLEAQPRAVAFTVHHGATLVARGQVAGAAPTP
ncbi:MAG TPA: hypothetical protein VML58_19495 [Burkholderiaceae bacterium]|nr:hypothetical protein [Burkholderiaceae bacterium]